MHVLVTGAAGYLGTVTVARLLAEGYSVTALDNFLHNQPSLSALAADEQLTIKRGDARDGALLSQLLKHADAVIALAAIVGAPACNSDLYAAGSVNQEAVFELCTRASRDQMILYPNTNSGYGVGGEALCTEESPLRPVSHYGRTKVAAEAAVLDKGGVSFRFATLFGPSARMRLDLMVNEFAYRAVTDRTMVLFQPGFRRNFLHVQDAAGAFLYALRYPHIFKGGGVYNAGDTSANMTKEQLCHRIKAQIQEFTWFIGAGEDPDKRDYVVSNAKLEAAGWEPQHTLDEGIAQLRNCYEQPFAHGAWRNA